MQDQNLKYDNKVSWIITGFMMFYLLLRPPVLIDNMGMFIFHSTAEPFYFLRSIVLIGFSIFLVFYSLYLSNKNQLEQKSLTYSEKALVLYGIFAMMSAFINPNFYSSFIAETARRDSVIILFCYILLFMFSFRYYKPSDKMINGFIFTVYILSLYAIMQYFQIEFFYMDEVRRKILFSAPSTIGNPNFFGSLLIMSFPIAFYMYLEKEKKIYLIFLSVMFFAMLCTRTRSAWLAFSFIFVIIGYLSYKRNSFKRFLRAFFFMVVGFILFILFDPAKEEFGSIILRFQSIIGEVLPSFKPNNPLYNTGGSRRLFIWSRTIEIIKDFPLLGVGYSNYKEVFMGRHLIEVFYEFDVFGYLDRAHNEYLQIAATTGLLGFAAYFMWVLSLLRKAYYKITKAIFKKEESSFEAFLSLSVIGYLIQAFFNISVVQVAPIFFIISGLMYQNNKKDLI